MASASMLACLSWGQSCWAQAEISTSTELGSSGVDAQLAGDFARAAELYRQACDVGDGGACALLGAMYVDREQGMEPDLDRALALYESGCNAGNAIACDAAKDMRATESEARQRELAAKAEDVEGGDDAKEAEADPSDPVPITVEQMQQGCDNNVGLDCLTLGYIYRDGNGAPKDFARAITMFRKACDISNIADPYDGHRGCHILASYHESGDGVPRDLERALQLYEKSCKAGNDDSCSQAKVVRLATGK
ncbi:MAG: tetratricopeptide repeat protein [Sphingomonadaceae bacterium]